MAPTLWGLKEAHSFHFLGTRHYSGESETNNNIGSKNCYKISTNARKQCMHDTDRGKVFLNGAVHDEAYHPGKALSPNQSQELMSYSGESLE